MAESGPGLELNISAPPPLTRPGVQPLLSVENLCIDIGQTRFVDNLTFDIRPGERVGLVGESGCGKTISGLSILGLNPASMKQSGRIRLDGQDLLSAPSSIMNTIRGGRIGMIFQEPMSALDPVFTVGEQISETVRRHRGFSRRSARNHAVQMLAAVGIPDPPKRYYAYPHQLSGGMRQRAMIAMALCCDPALLIADEPTTALDVTVQAQIIDLLLELSEQNGVALLMITHDLGVVAELCSRVITMYAGQIVEDGAVDRVFLKPFHPYTSGLLRSMPRVSKSEGRLPSIAGRVPSFDSMPKGCRFEPRCIHADECCQIPVPLAALQERRVRCCRQAELSLPGARD